MLNLVTNALEAMKNGGLLKLSVIQANVITLDVSITAPGIPWLREKFFNVLHDQNKRFGNRVGDEVGRAVA